MPTFSLITVLDGVERVVFGFETRDELARVLRKRGVVWIARLGRSGGSLVVRERCDDVLIDIPFHMFALGRAAWGGTERSGAVAALVAAE